MNAISSMLPLCLLMLFHVLCGSLRVILQLFFCCCNTQSAWRAALYLYHWLILACGLLASSIAVKSSSSSSGFFSFAVFMIKFLSMISSQLSHSSGSNTKSSQSSTNISMLIFCVLSVVLASQCINEASSRVSTLSTLTQGRRAPVRACYPLVL